MPAVSTVLELETNKITLRNGLDVIVHPRRTLPLVAVNLWYHVGSKNEEANQRGYAHLFEHLMFEGSRHYPGDYFQHLQKLGANINGSTSSDRTNYFVDLPAAHAELAIAMESDRMANLVPALDESKLRIQKGVVTNEYRQNYENQPYGLAWFLIAEALYPAGHPYSWLTIGVMEDLEAASLADVSAFFRRYYVPANSSLCVAGDLDPERAFALAERYFGGIAGGVRALLPGVAELELRETMVRTHRDKVELDRLYLVWPSVRHYELNDAPLAVLADLLSRGRASRLYRKLVIEEQVAQSVSAFQNGRELAGAFGVVATLRPGRSIAEARALIESELSSLAAERLEEGELARVKRMRRAAFLGGLERLGGFGGVADRLNAANVFRGDPRAMVLDQERFDRVQGEDVARVAARYLVGRPRVELEVLGRGRSTVAAIDRAIAPGPAPMASYRPELPVESRLESGATLAVFPLPGRGLVSGEIVITGGASEQDPRGPGLANAMASMIDEGTRKRTAAELAIAIESLGATLHPSCGWDGFHLEFHCLKDDLAACLDLVFDVLHEPSFPEEEWRRIQAQLMAGLRSERDNPDSLSQRALLALLYPPGHPYRVPLAGTPAALERIDRGALAGFHERLMAPGRAALVLAGDLTPNFAAELAAGPLARWKPRQEPLTAIASPERPRRPRIVVLDRPGAPQAVLRAGYVGLTHDDPDFDRMIILNQILGGQFTSRLNATLREERGLTYGVRSGFDCRRSAGPFAISASIQADRAAEALDCTRIEVERLLGGKPPEQAEIDDARRAVVDGRTRVYETTGGLISRYAALWLRGLSFEHERRLAERMAAFSRDELIETAPRVFHPEALTAVIVADAEQVRPGLEKLEWGAVEVVSIADLEEDRLAPLGSPPVPAAAQGR